MSNSNRTVTLKSATEGLYATIPAFMVRNRAIKTFKCMHSDNKQSILVDADKLRELLMTRQLYFTKKAETNSLYIKSKDYIKFFK